MKQDTRNRKIKHEKRVEKSYKKLIVWQVTNEFVVLVYAVTAKFPIEERFGLVSQTRRAAVSVVLNIVEGYARGNPGDFSRFLDISFGSLCEVEYLLELSKQLGFLSDGEYDRLESVRSRCGKLLWNYRKKVKGSRKT